MALATSGAWRLRPEAMFWDYASCDQKAGDTKRSPEEQARFDKALTVMSQVYATPNTLVMQHKRLPADFPREQPTYERSGWCNMEQAAASLATARGAVLYELRTGWVRLHARARKSPREMAALFADERRTVFVGRADRDYVAGLYKTLHEEVVAFDDAKLSFFVKMSDFFVTQAGPPIAAAIFWFSSSWLWSAMY